MRLRGTEQERLNKLSYVTVYRPDPDNYINEDEFKAARELYYKKIKAINNTADLLINKVV